MGVGWNQFRIQLHKVLWFLLIFHWQIEECSSLNLEGIALLNFRSRVEIDPFGALENWNPIDDDPCNWSGIECTDGKVTVLDLEGLSLTGMLVPELEKLSYLKALILYKNNFFGVIPKEIGRLSMLEILDLRSNKFTGKIPEEIGKMLSLKQLLLCNNSFHQGLPLWLGKMKIPSELQADHCSSLDITVEISRLNRKFGHRIWQRCLQQLKKAKLFMIPLKKKFLQFLSIFLMSRPRVDNPYDYKKDHGENLLSSAETYSFEHAHHYTYSARRRLLQEATNLPAAPSNGASPQATVIIVSTGSGSFPAVPTSAKGRDKQAAAPVPSHTFPPVHNAPTIPVKPILSSGSASDPNDSLENQSGGTKRTWAYVFVLPGAAVLLILAAGMLVICRTHGRPVMIGPWKTGLSGQLQKAFIAGVPKINRAELEAACEDFSNIIQAFPDCTIFKGTLSSGVEIAVVSTAIASFKDWSKRSETLFQKKIDSLSRVNHKNFVNLLGYCEENEPFTRMMVFEYAPSGSLFEHLHVKELEHLDWAIRMRIVMGVAYCLQYMHHELKPPVVHPNLRSNAIYLTDDNAAKIADVGFWKEFIAKQKLDGDDFSDISESPSTHTGSNIYDFGILILEIISGRHPHSEEQGSILNWAVEYLNDKHSVSRLIDPTLKHFKNNELDIICEVIQDCIHQDPKTRPTMKDITAKLREVLSISPESATPRLSPLWWAELEILSLEAS
ncbi:hypothetical protein Taro_007827 [Colocasia esculenta]|uniref:Protein kinase domain-containing protein n=1 Tax=Colocasia esculenta TaxID=4460 RepID=A0A843TVB9_COLES|nr:hypothetical protein [Colocasia esculenta]